MRLPRRLMLSFGIFFLTAVIAILLVQLVQRPAFAAAASAGELQIMKDGKPAGACPLRHTDVKAGISGFIARVVVTQEFVNSSGGKIEAVYTFPLPQDAAVNDMTIQVGTRTIRGMIKRREEAAAIYARAIQRGQTAALLDQERPNIFTQTVGNIPPGETVRVMITYTARLKYEDGGYEFVFPMVVGPRYVPGNKAIGRQGGGFSPDTDKVPDASKVTPPIAPPGTRAGHDISIALALDAGIPVQRLRSPSHDIEIQRLGATSATVRLRKAAEIPNKDFILRYDVAGPSIVEGLLTHTALTKSQNSRTDGYFSLVIQPPERFPEHDVSPKEMVFVLDSSGSMNGFPVEKSKRLIDYALDGLYPGDTFNIIKFSGETAVLFGEPVYPTAENVRRAREFVNSYWGGGGTEMMKAIRAALVPSDSSDHLRIVVFLTDGYVGNDMEIVGEIQKHTNARVFAYGIGSSVNRFLLDKMAEAGRGAVEYVSQKQNDKEAESAAHRLYDRLRAPLLTDISLDFGSLPVTDVYPRQIPDLFSAKPVIITGRFTAPARGTIRLQAKRAGDPYTREIPITLPAEDEGNEVLPSLWARQKIDNLMSEDWLGLQRGNMRAGLRDQITQLGLDYRLMTQFTSFVAVEERVVTEGGKPERIQVPVELPEGVQYEEGWSGAPGTTLSMQAKLASPVVSRIAPAIGGPAGGVVGGVVNGPPAAVAGSGGGIGSGSGAGVGPGVGPGRGGGYGGGVYRVGGGVTAPRAIHTPEPQLSDEARQGRVQGSVVLTAVIDATGKPGDVRVTRSLGMGLDEKAIQAIRNWKFQPAMKDGRPVAAQVNIEVAFANGGAKSSVTSPTSALPTSTPVSSIDKKLHPKLAATYECWRAQKEAAPANCKLASDRLLVELVVSDDSAAAVERLKKIGFEPSSAKSRARHLIGRIPVARFDALTELDFVKFVAPVEGESR